MILIDDYDTIRTQRGLACNYECVKESLNTKYINEYNGPVKIIVKKSPADKYNLIANGAAGLTVCNFLIGGFALTILVREAATLGYAKTARLHVVFCTLGMTFLSSFGMINIFRLFGASHALKKDDIKKEHFNFHLAGLLSSIIGLLFQASGPYMKGSEKHISLCMIGLLLGIASFITGMLLSFKKKKKVLLGMIHVASGAFSYFWYTCCYVTGLQSRHFKQFCIKYYKGRGCYILDILHGVVCFIVVFASLTHILLLIKIGKKPVDVCLTEKEVEEMKIKKEEDKMEEEEKRKKEEAEEAEEAKAAYIEKKVLEAEELKKKAEELKKKKPEKEIKIRKAKKTKPKKVKKVRR